VSIRMVVGNSTSWSGTVDLSPYPELGNLRILPVDAVGHIIFDLWVANER
jgi:hypothetical protein